MLLNHQVGALQPRFGNGPHEKAILMEVADVGHTISYGGGKEKGWDEEAL